MSETVSKHDPDVLFLDEVEDFRKHSTKLVRAVGREVLILSTRLDIQVFDNSEFHQALIDFVNKNRYASVRILVKDINDMLQKGHFVLRLSRRLSSKVEIRKLLHQPQNEEEAYIIGDRHYLLYQHEDHVYKGSVSEKAAVRCESMIEEFNWLWESHSHKDPSLSTFVL